MLFGQADVSVDYLKEDGFIGHFTLHYVNGSLSMVRQDLPSDSGFPIMDLALYAGVVAVVLLVVVVVYYLRKR